MFICVESSSIVNDIFDSVGNVFNIRSKESGNCDSSIFSQIDVMFISQHIALFRSKSGVTEHSDLFCNMIPVTLSSILDKSCFQVNSHFVHSISYNL